MILFNLLKLVCYYTFVVGTLSWATYATVLNPTSIEDIPTELEDTLVVNLNDSLYYSLDLGLFDAVGFSHFIGRDSSNIRVVSDSIVDFSEAQQDRDTTFHRAYVKPHLPLREHLAALWSKYSDRMTYFEKGGTVDGWIRGEEKYLWKLDSIDRIITNAEEKYKNKQLDSYPRQVRRVEFFSDEKPTSWITYLNLDYSLINWNK